MVIDKEMIMPELLIKATRSSGKGGQNVNKVSSRIEVDFNIERSALFSPEQKALLLQRLGNRINKEGYIKVTVQEERSQLLNKQKAVLKMLHLLQKNLETALPRKATKPSKSSVLKRLKTKQLHAEKKAARQKIL